MVLEYRATEEALRAARPRADAARAGARESAHARSRHPHQGPASRACAELAGRRCGAATSASPRTWPPIARATTRYFEANEARAREKVTKLDTVPRVVLVPGVGIFAAGRDQDRRAHRRRHRRAHAARQGAGERHRALRGALRRRPLRHGVLGARAGEARQGEPPPARGPGGAGHRRRRGDRLRHREAAGRGRRARRAGRRRHGRGSQQARMDLDPKGKGLARRRWRWT